MTVAKKIANHAAASYFMRGNCSGVEIAWMVQKLRVEYSENKQARISTVIVSRLIAPILP
jgi:hypothetical protein